ncbi:uncharacterized protein LOC135815760 [Sycon ciliatum]|uniref:uncharacterized protein LOC135815760 n=1 Tax=Sycon ciliatum TaxID=27933 RepID=UPI0020AAA645|eukprot:scpid61114/ scgid22926/ T-cell acute lymphocytic leukemia protein 1; Class A basic helix-loop-helix protein 17; Stem cell protein; T-cell leukemia/lymphoma protein 5
MGLNFGESNSVVDSGLGSSPTLQSLMALSASPESPTGSSPSLNDGEFEGDHSTNGANLRGNLSGDQVANIIATDGRRPSRRRTSEDEDDARTARRLLTNRRERWRQQLVNDAFMQLRKLIPTFPPDKKLSKHDVLKQASRYIVYVQTILTDSIEQQQRAINPETAKTMTGSIREKQDWHFASMYTHMPLGSPTQGMATFPGSLTPSRSAETLARQAVAETYQRPSSTANSGDSPGYYPAGGPAGGFPGLPEGHHRSTVPQAQPARHISATSPPYSEAYAAPAANARTQASMSSGAMHEESMSRTQPQAVSHGGMRQSIDDRSISPQQSTMPPGNNFSGWIHPNSTNDDSNAQRHIDYGHFHGRSTVEHPNTAQPIIYSSPGTHNESKNHHHYQMPPSTQQSAGHYSDERFRYIPEQPPPHQDSYHPNSMSKAESSRSANHRTPPTQTAHAALY